ncbi:MAG: anti-sigma factor family protein, partial [Acidimicrobiales bacterium]
MIRRWWTRRRRALVCRDAVALMGDYLDGTLASPDVRRLEAHLADCPHCSEHLAQLRA